MKRLLVCLVLCLCTIGVFGQEVPDTNKVLKDTTIKSVTYKLYQGSRGGKYVWRKSATGKFYKQYIKK